MSQDQSVVGAAHTERSDGRPISCECANGTDILFREGGLDGGEEEAGAACDCC